jgi:predicted transcriptional regulator
MAADDDEGRDNDERVTVRIPADLARNVRGLARANDETLSRIVRRAFRAYLTAGPQQLDLEDGIRSAPAKRKAGAAKATTKAKPKPQPRR